MLIWTQVMLSVLLSCSILAQLAVRHAILNRQTAFARNIRYDREVRENRRTYPSALSRWRSTDNDNLSQFQGSSMWKMTTFRMPLRLAKRVGA